MKESTVKKNLMNVNSVVSVFVMMQVYGGIKTFTPSYLDVKNVENVLVMQDT